MKTTFKKITAASLAALTLAFGFCATAFAAEKDTDKEDYPYRGASEYMEEKEYDIDTGIIFDDWEIAEGTTYIAGGDFIYE